MRVTITLPDDLHRGIQAVRGAILSEAAVDLSYSNVVEMVLRCGVAHLAEVSPDELGSKGAFEAKDQLSKSAYKSIDATFTKAMFGDVLDGIAEMPKSWLVEPMLPFLLYPSKVKADFEEADRSFQNFLIGGPPDATTEPTKKTAPGVDFK